MDLSSCLLPGKQPPPVCGIMLRRSSVKWIALGVMVFGTSVVSAQNYPAKAIRVVAAEPGGGTDFVARPIAQGLAGPLGQPVIVENRPTSVIAETVARSPADGYTLLVAGTILWLSPFLRDNLSYDPVRDFAPISLTNRSPNILVVHPSLPATNVKELIALARRKPGALNYGTAGAGTSPHLAGELLQSMAGIKLMHIPYKGAGPALIALIRGDMQLAFPNAGSASPHLKSGRLKALAVTSAQPSVLLPGLPTVASSGLAGYESVSIFGLFAPAATPRAIVSRLNEEVVRIFNGTDLKERFLNAGSEVVASSPEQLAAAIKLEMTVLGKLIKDAGIRSD